MIESMARLSRLTCDELSVSDVGRQMAGRVVELSDYLAVEEAYVETARRFLAQMQVELLRVEGLEVYGGCDSLPEGLGEESKKYLESVKDGQEVCGENLVQVIRLVLREIVWCRLEGGGGVYVHFGYDYYMYIGSKEKRVSAPSVPSGIFVKICESPCGRA